MGQLRPRPGKGDARRSIRLAGTRQARRPAADAGHRPAPLVTRIRPQAPAAAHPLEPAVGGLRREPSRRRPHRALGAGCPGDRRVCGAARRRLPLRRQVARPAARGGAATCGASPATRTSSTRRRSTSSTWPTTRRMRMVPAGQRESYASAAAGAIAQNVYLYAASAGLATVIRAWIDRPAIADALGPHPRPAGAAVADGRVPAQGVMAQNRHVSSRDEGSTA